MLIKESGFRFNNFCLKVVDKSFRGSCMMPFKFKTLNCDQVNFKGSSENSSEILLKRLKQDYLLLCTQDRLTPQHLFGSLDGEIIEKEINLLHSINRIVEESNPNLDKERVKKLLDRKIEDYREKFSRKGIIIPDNCLEKTFREVLDDYLAYIKQKKALQSQIFIIENDKNVPVIAGNNDTGKVGIYNSHIESSRNILGNPNTSYEFRYPHLHSIISKLAMEKVNQLDLSVDKSDNKDKKINFLLVGLGQSCEELFDYTMYMQDSLSNTSYNLNDIVDMQVVDFRPKKDFQLQYMNPPMTSSAIIDDVEIQKRMAALMIKHPRFRDNYTYPLDVWEFGYNVVNDVNKFHSSCAIEDYSKAYNGKGFDFISINNVLQYPGYGEHNTLEDVIKLPLEYKFLNPLKCPSLKDPQLFEEYKSLLERIFKMIKPGGYISCIIGNPNGSNILDKYITMIPSAKEFEKVSDGLYRRKM